jgi:hypothetical protein
VHLVTAAREKGGGGGNNPLPAVDAFAEIRAPQPRRAGSGAAPPRAVARQCRGRLSNPSGRPRAAGCHGARVSDVSDPGRVAPQSRMSARRLNPATVKCCWPRYSEQRRAVVARMRSSGEADGSRCAWRKPPRLYQSAYARSAVRRWRRTPARMFPRDSARAQQTRPHTSPTHPPSTHPTRPTHAPHARTLTTSRPHTPTSLSLPRTHTPTPHPAPPSSPPTPHPTRARTTRPTNNLHAPQRAAPPSSTPLTPHSHTRSHPPLTPRPHGRAVAHREECAYAQ